MLILFLCCAFAVIYLARQAYSRLWRRDLDAEITFSDPAVYAGETVTLEEVITNRKHLPLPRLEVSFRIPKGLEFLDAENTVLSDYVYKRDVFSLRSMEMIKRRYRVSCTQRGRYQVSQLRLRSQSFFGKTDELSVGSPQPQFLVYAGRTDVSGADRLCDQLLGEQESRRSLYEDPFLFNGIRNYQPSDPMKRINWKAMARTGGLMVNTFASVQAVSFMIYLDISDEKIIKEDELVEEGIRAAAVLIRRQISLSQQTGLVINSDPPVRFEPGRGHALLSKIEYELTADFRSGDTVPFLSLLADETDTSPVIRILISKDIQKKELEKLPFTAIVMTPSMKDGVPVTICRLAGSRR